MKDQRKEPRKDGRKGTKGRNKGTEGRHKGRVLTKEHRKKGKMKEG